MSLLLSFAAPSAHAQQNDDWFVTLYNRYTAEFIQVDASGETHTYPLTLADVTDPNQETDIAVTQMAFTPDGSQAAFCYTYFAPPPAGNQTRLIVRDIAGQTNLLDLDMNPTLRCHVSPTGFNQDGTLLAVSKINYDLGGDPSYPGQPAWQLLVIEVASGEIVVALDQPDEVTFEGANESILPLTRLFDGSVVIFNAMPFPTNSLANLPVYAWDISTGSITPETNGRFNNDGGDLLRPTGERVWFEEDSSLPAGRPADPAPLYNVVRYAVNSSAAPMTIFHDPDEIIVEVTFIEDGARLGILLLGSYDESQPDDTNPHRWIALDRAGNIEELGSTSHYADIFALPANYGVFVYDFRPDSAELSISANGEMQQLWSSDERGWQMAFTPPIRESAPDLTPFVEWQ